MPNWACTVRGAPLDLPSSSLAHLDIGHSLLCAGRARLLAGALRERTKVNACVKHELILCKFVGQVQFQLGNSKG